MSDLYQDMVSGKITAEDIGFEDNYASRIEDLKTVGIDANNSAFEETLYGVMRNIEFFIERPEAREFWYVPVVQFSHQSLDQQAESMKASKGSDGDGSDVPGVQDENDVWDEDTYFDMGYSAGLPETDMILEAFSIGVEATHRELGRDDAAASLVYMRDSVDVATEFMRLRPPALQDDRFSAYLLLRNVLHNRDVQDVAIEQMGSAGEACVIWHEASQNEQAFRNLPDVEQEMFHEFAMIERSVKLIHLAERLEWVQSHEFEYSDLMDEMTKMMGMAEYELEQMLRDSPASIFLENVMGQCEDLVRARVEIPAVIAETQCVSKGWLMIGTDVKRTVLESLLDATRQQDNQPS